MRMLKQQRITISDFISFVAKLKLSTAPFSRPNNSAPISRHINSTNSSYKRQIKSIFSDSGVFAPFVPRNTEHL